MATTIIDTAVTGAHAVAKNDRLIVSETGSITHPNGSAIYDTGSDTTVLIRGKVQSRNPVILLDDQSAGDGNHKVTIARTGRVESATSNGIFIEGGNSAITNRGLIKSDRFGIEMEGANQSFVNIGRLNGGSFYAFKIEGEACPVSLNTSMVTNSGTILGGNKAVTIFDTDLVFENTGEIKADSIALSFKSTCVGGVFDAKITNSGLIKGAVNAVDLVGNGNDKVFNLGTMKGDVALRGGDDLFDGRGGTVTGTVYGGDGNDTYIIDALGITLFEARNEGADHVRSSVSHALAKNFESLSLSGAGDIHGTGNAENNSIDGNAGSNRLAGGGGNDVMTGKGGNDTLLGGKGRDTLSGERGADKLIGGVGADHLFGGDGQDRLIGGTGQDKMTGGGGQDTFLFNNAAESPFSSADRITDFTPGEDELDLTALALSNVYIDSGFSGGGIASARTRETAGGHTIVLVDLDGNARSEMKILLDGTTNVTASDFIL